MTSEDKKFVTDVERGWLTESLFDTIHRLCRIIRELEKENKQLGEYVDGEALIERDKLLTEIETVRSTLSNLQEEIATLKAEIADAPVVYSDDKETDQEGDSNINWTDEKLIRNDTWIKITATHRARLVRIEKLEK